MVSLRPTKTVVMNWNTRTAVGSRVRGITTNETDSRERTNIMRFLSADSDEAKYKDLLHWCVTGHVLDSLQVSFLLKQIHLLEAGLCFHHQLNTNLMNQLNGYTMHQQYPTLYFPSNAHNVKKRRVIKTF